MASEKLWLAGRVMTKHLDGDRPAGLRTHLLVGRSASTRRSVGDSGGMGHRRQVREKVAQRARQQIRRRNQTTDTVERVGRE